MKKKNWAHIIQGIRITKNIKIQNTAINKLRMKKKKILGTCNSYYKNPYNQ